MGGGRGGLGGREMFLRGWRVFLGGLRKFFEEQN